MLPKTEAEKIQATRDLEHFREISELQQVNDYLLKQQVALSERMAKRDVKIKALQRTVDTLKKRNSKLKKAVFIAQETGQSA